MNKEVENAKQCIKNSCEGLALETIEKYYNKKIERLNNIINELEKWLNDNENLLIHYDYESKYEYIYVDELLDKLKELKEKSDIDC